MILISVRKKHSSVLCPNNGEKIIVNKYKKEFTHCDIDLKERAISCDPESLLPLEWKEDIYAVDYMKQHRLFHKIYGTRIKEKIKKNQIVD